MVAIDVRNVTSPSNFFSFKKIHKILNFLIKINLVNKNL